MSRIPFLLALLCLPLVVGCEGCRRDRGAENEEEEAPLEDYSAKPAQAFPADANLGAGGIKPGHWLTAAQAIKSNKVDARGELQSRISASGTNRMTGESVSSRGELPSFRPVVLPKGQTRRFDYRILAPPVGAQDQSRAYLSSRFVSTGRTVFFDTGSQPFNVLSSEEFFFVILTTRPQRFAKFQVSDWVRPLKNELSFRQDSSNYRIVFPPTDDLLPLSETMLDWTSTAVVLWDDLSPDALTPQQQLAISDWVRFGGQLIVNGAVASDAISRTTLNDLLPLTPTGNIELDPNAATELLEGWSVPNDRTLANQVALMRDQAGRVAVDGRAADDAQALPGSGKLVLVRRVGNGRVVQPRFDVTSDWMVTWDSYDSFVNSALLDRPHRKIVKDQDALADSFLQQEYAEYGMTTADPAMNSKFRIAARDAVLRIGGGMGPAGGVPSRIDPLTAVDGRKGISGWTDQSDTIRLCREILQNESGIEIPDSSLVVRSLGIYLLILVPVNYLVFRLLGRLEYAWLAVPVIAIAGAAWVARAARLDIGFARKQTELAVLELQPDYHRGHLTRLIAIYNSLSSTYSIEFDSVDSVAAPIWDETTGDPPTFRTNYGIGPMLSGFSVESNDTQLMHAEQMVDVGGPIRLDGQGNVVNQSEFEMYDAFVVEKVGSDQVRLAMLGPFPPGSVNKLRFQDVRAPAITDALPMQTLRMIRRLSEPAAMPNDSVRLVARIDAAIPGMTVTPDASQAEAQTIVLAHLKYPPLPVPQVDVNLITDFRRALGRNEDSQLPDDVLQDDNP